MNERYFEVWLFIVVIKFCDQGVVDFCQGQVIVMVLVYIGGYKVGYVGKVQFFCFFVGFSFERYYKGDWCRGEIGFREVVNQQ